MKPNISSSIAQRMTLLAVAWLLARGTAPAQSASVRIVPIIPQGGAPQANPAPPKDDDVDPAKAEASANAGPGPGGAGRPVQPPDLAKELAALKFDRSPQALLEATRAQRKGAALSPAEEFKMAVLFGDWTSVGKTLASLPADGAAEVYSKLLATLAEQSIPVGEVLKTPSSDSGEEDPYERMNRLRNEARQLKEKPAPLLSEDFYAIVDASPAPLHEELIPSVAKLAKTTLGEGGRATLVKRLQGGWKGLGGAELEGRKLATALLSALGWIEDAAPFLPLDPKDWEKADTTQLVFAMEYHTRKGVAENDERELERAAALCAWLMKTSRFGNYTRPQFRLAMDRIVQLLPVLEPAAAQKLIREQLFQQTATLADLISVFGELGQTATKGDDLKDRAASLGTQHLILEALATLEGTLPANIVVPVMNWLVEAEGCYRAGGAVATDMTQAERMMMRRYGMNRQNEVTTLSTEQILATAPPAGIIQRLNPGLAQRVRLTLLKVNILKPEEVDLSMLRDYLKAHPGLEREICQDVLSGWVSKRTKPAESEQVKQMRAYGMYVPPQMLQAGSGIPLTRLRQNQNIAQFRKLLEELRAISPEPLDPSLIVQAFMTLHSGAEVYRLADIEAIFGPPEKMVRAELLDLLDGMRGRLAESWRDPAAQQQAGTNRTEEEAKDEVSRGYRTALELAKRGILAEHGDWQAFVTRGQLFFDASQYEFERKVKLADYVNLRDQAFDSFRKAAALYAAKLPSMPRGQWTVDPYQAWFIVMLGASDLSQLTLNTARSDPGLQSIGDAMRALPGEAAAKHVELFARMLGDLFPRVPANVRQKFLNSGLRIVGESHPAAKQATRSLDYYRELIDEVRLNLAVDGPSWVGHTRPFGAFLGIESTRQLLRESGGFAKYLQGPVSQQQAMMTGRPPGARDLRGDLAKNIHAALDETFEVVSITWHDPAVKPLDLPREGWVETPLAYLVLRAKNAAVDRIPSIQIDMDFIDQPGQVVLPVMSQVQPIDAGGSEVGTRPCPGLALTLTMDEREWRDSKVVVEIQARGEGIIPALEELFECRRDGFNLEATDGTLAVSQYTSDGTKRMVSADRNWQLTYRRKAGLRGSLKFPFPALKPGIQTATIEYKHYQDADLVTIDSARAASGVMLPGRASGVIGKVLAALIAMAAIVIAVLRLRRRKQGETTTTSGIRPPRELSAFSTLAFLQRIRDEHGETLTPDEHQALRSQIHDLEAACFSGKESPAIDFDPIIERWLTAAHRSA